MVHKSIFGLFKKGSKTYFYSSLFFPTKIRDDIFILYAFVRKADNFVDQIPQQLNEFYKFKNDYQKAIKKQKIDNIVTTSFVDLMQRKKIPVAWVNDFLKAMEMDIKKKRYATINQLIEYMHGSAEVVGLIMAKIIDLPEKSYTYSKYLGRAMQYINFIRDIVEDLQLGRIYLPMAELKKYKLKDLDYLHTSKYEENFKLFLIKQLKCYAQWQKYAEKGFKFIPKSYLIPIKTASEMYNWTAEQIRKDPFIVYRKKVKPSVFRIMITIIKNVIIIKKVLA